MIKEILTELQEIKELLGLQKKMLTVEEFCRYTGISKQQAYKLTANRKIKFYKPSGKIIFFDLDDVVHFLRTNPIADKRSQQNLINKYLNK